ncbi:MAG: phenylacetate-CoA oxygenase subunit PaaC [Thiothrix sp.]|nr:phenylacetate-CoA oxygenase subunit PaaC [Thiothrix sp.]
MTDQDLRQATQAYAVRLGDDALILGHRLSEWTSRAPFLEEDLALQNVALDYIGRARMFYGYAAELSADGRTEDDFAYLRDARQFSNLLIHELPRGDFAFTMARQLLTDVFSSLYLEQLLRSTDATLAGIAAKAAKETRYHLRRSREWALRLGDGTDESHARMVRAIDELWGYTHELFELDALEQQLADAGIGVDNAALRPAWLKQVSAILTEATLRVPEDSWVVRGGRTGYHTENLGHILSEMQSVHRAYPGVSW